MKVEFFANLLNPELKVNVRGFDGTDLDTITAEQLKTSTYKDRTVLGWNISISQYKDFIVVNII